MSDITQHSEPPESKALIEQQADRWFVLMRSDTRTEKDILEHKAWLNTNLACREAYSELEVLWERAGHFIDMPEIRTACQKLKHSIRSETDELSLVTTSPTYTKQSPKKSLAKLQRFRWSAFAVAASLMVVLYGSELLSETAWLKNAWYSLLTDKVYQTAIGEQKTFTLTDGSTLLLDTQTTVREEFSSALRQVVLERGQARFDVVSDSERPFVVKADKGDVTAIGTAFVVRKDSGQILVTLIKGKVKVASTVSRAEGVLSPSNTLYGRDTVPVDQKIELNVGQQTSYSGDGLSMIKTVDISQVTSWQTGRLVFEEYALGDVVKELNRYSYKKILLGDKSLAKLRVTGVFKSGDNNKAIHTLQSYFSLNVSIDTQKNLVLTPKI